MKTKITIGVIIAMAIVSIAASPSPKAIRTVPKNAKQLYAAFDFFRVHRQGKNGATATWGMSSESGITCFVVQRTYFDPTDPYSPWDDLCVMPSNGSRSYKWTDANLPYPGIINYRIKAMVNPGGEMYSGTESIHIVSH